MPPHQLAFICGYMCLIVVHVWVNLCFYVLCVYELLICLPVPDIQYMCVHLVSYLWGKGQRKWGRRCVFVFFPLKECLPYDICYAWTNKYLKCIMHIVILTVISWNFKISYYCGSMIYGFYMAAGPVLGPSQKFFFEFFRIIHCIKLAFKNYDYRFLALGSSQIKETKNWLRKMEKSSHYPWWINLLFEWTYILNFKIQD